MSAIKTTSLISVCLTFVFLFGCQSENDNQKIVGHWQGISWSVKGQPSGRDAGTVHFEFNADDTYSASFGAQKEEGKFRLVKSNLYTTAKEQSEKMVQVALPSPDTLIMDMNRAGTLEQLILVKR
ncbi:MAG TPA: hypothetical protein ENJ20_04265 [Bacteroidetes bacterium]|nr:hypothetical protein [Bacteroidota bacterium]